MIEKIKVKMKNEVKKMKKVMMKKISNKMIIGEMLMSALKNDSRFTGMSLDDVIVKIETLRKNNESHLSDYAYALFIAYKNGLSVFKKYVKNFKTILYADYNAVARKMRRYNSLIQMFSLVSMFVTVKKQLNVK